MKQIIRILFSGNIHRNVLQSLYLYWNPFLIFIIPLLSVYYSFINIVQYFVITNIKKIFLLYMVVKNHTSSMYFICQGVLFTHFIRGIMSLYYQTSRSFLKTLTVPSSRYLCACVCVCV